MLQKQACQHESKLHVAKFKTCMLQQAACQHQLKLHVAKKSMSTWIQHACCTIQDMHVAPIKTKKIMLPLHVRTCQGQRGLFIGTPSVTHTLTRCGGESSSKNTRFLVTWFLHVNMHTDCTCCLLWYFCMSTVHVACCDFCMSMLFVKKISTNKCLYVLNWGWFESNLPPIYPGRDR